MKHRIEPQPKKVTYCSDGDIKVHGHIWPNDVTDIRLINGTWYWIDYQPEPQVMADFESLPKIKLSKAVDIFRRRDELIEAYFKGFCPTLDKINQDQPEDEPSPEPVGIDETTEIDLLQEITKVDAVLCRIHTVLNHYSLVDKKQIEAAEDEMNNARNDLYRISRRYKSEITCLKQRVAKLETAIRDMINIGRAALGKESK